MPRVTIQEAVLSVHALVALVIEIRAVRKAILANLYELKKEVEESYNKSRIAKIAGTGSSIIGGVCGIIGMVTAPVTFGASVALLAAGAAFGAAGGITTGGAEVGYYFVSKEKLKRAVKLCDTDAKKVRELQEASSRFTEIVKQLSVQFETSENDIFIKLREIFKEATSDRINGTVTSLNRAYCAYKFVDSAIDATKVGKAGARTVWTALSTSGRLIRVVGAVADAVFLPIDIAVMIKSIYDIYQYKAENNSTSNRADEIQQLITHLEEHQQRLGKILDNDEVNLI